MKNISQDVINILNYRIEQEELSSRMYKAMSIWLSYNGFEGAASLWEKYSDEELEHAEYAYEYLLDLDIKPEVPALVKPNNEFTGLVDIIQKSYDHETEVTRQCQEFAKIAFQNSDYMALELAQKYLKEQQEELAKTTLWLDMIESFGSSKESLFLLDNKMGSKV